VMLVVTLYTNYCNNWVMTSGNWWASALFTFLPFIARS